jgi:hypothetical protein
MSIALEIDRTQALNWRALDAWLAQRSADGWRLVTAVIHRLPDGRLDVNASFERTVA